MESLQINSTKIECRKGDISQQQDVQAVVNAANAELAPGGGVAGAIHRAAGPSLAEECRPIAPIETGEAVITEGHGLPNHHVIHSLGPVYGQEVTADSLLSACFRNSLHLAEEYRLRSIAFPAISAGAFGYPIERAARIAVHSVKEVAVDLKSVQLVRFVLYSNKDFQVFKSFLLED